MAHNGRPAQTSGAFNATFTGRLDCHLFRLRLAETGSGTWGSLAALAPGLLIAQHFGAAGLIVAAAFAYGLGHWASTVWIDGTEDKDPSPIVIDEVAGLWLTLTLAPLTPLGIALAFACFACSIL